MAQTKLPTRFGIFQLYLFHEGNERKDHLALVKGKIENERSILVRIHSECLTGDALFSQRCDCRAQLEKSFEILGKAKSGMILYLRQEGRGIGLLNKIRAYALQDEGFDTFEANRKLGLPADARDYEIAIEILKYFKISKIRLLSNNPEKISALRPHFDEVKRVPLITKSNRYNRKYLQTKKERFGHLFKTIES